MHQDDDQEMESVEKEGVEDKSRILPHLITKENNGMKVKIIQLDSEEPRESNTVKVVVDEVDDDNQSIHGFLENRTIFVDHRESAMDPVSGNPNSFGHFNFLRSCFEEALKEKLYNDTTLILADSIMSLNRLLAVLIFPWLNDSENQDLDTIILPDYSLEQIQTTFDRFLGGSNSGSVGNGLISSDKNLRYCQGSPQNEFSTDNIEVNFLNLSPIPMNEVLLKPEFMHSEPLHNDEEQSLIKFELKCSRCNVLFSSEIALEDHLNKCGQQNYSCQICKKSFKNMYSLVTHEVENHEESNVGGALLTEFDPVQCFKCKSVMTKASELYDHGCTQTKYNPTKCTLCKKILSNKTQMLGHVCPKLMRKNERTVGDAIKAFDNKNCFTCNKEFSSIRRTIIHEVEECNNLWRKSHPDFRLKIYNCDHCERNFVIKRKFNLHMERHAKEKSDINDVMKAQKLAAKVTVSTIDEESLDQGSNIENVDPKNVVNEEVGTFIDPTRLTVDQQIVSEEDIKEFDENLKRKETDFLKAVKQLQELEEGSTTCVHCGKKLSSRKACLEHEVNVHGDLSNAEQYYRCEYCPKFFINKTLRNNHLTTHTDERKYQCHLCAQRFKTTGNLNAHLASCHDPEDTGLFKRFKCQFCPKTFRFPAQIMQHERVHTKEKPFNCDLCGKGFSVKCNLKAHLETHKSLDERNYKCSICNHSATTYPLLKLHMHSHTGERPYVCELCGESYKRPSNLRRHKKAMCKLRPGAPIIEESYEDEELYERIETVVVQGEDEGDIVIETGEYEESHDVFEVQDGVIIQEMPNVLIEDICDTVVEEGIVEDDGIKYETELVTL